MHVEIQTEKEATVARTARAGILVAALASLLAVLMPGTANAADPAIRYTTSLRNASIYEMRASYSWQCIDVRGGSTSPGAIIQRYDCNGKLHQRFYFMQSGTPGLFTIGTLGRYCIGANLTPGPDYYKTVVTGYCQGPGQLFRWVDQGNNHWEIVEAQTGLCLHDTGRRNPVELRPCGNITVPYPSLWTPRYHTQYDYGSIWG